VADGRRCLRDPDGTPVEVRLSEDPEAPACVLRTHAFALPALPCLPPGRPSLDHVKPAPALAAAPPPGAGAGADAPAVAPAGKPAAAAAHGGPRAPSSAQEPAAGAGAGAPRDAAKLAKSGPVPSKGSLAHASKGASSQPNAAWPVTGADRGLLTGARARAHDSSSSFDGGVGAGTRLSGEVWLIQELCTGGTLQDAVESGRFHGADGALDVPAVLATAQVLAVVQGLQDPVQGHRTCDERPTQHACASAACACCACVRTSLPLPRSHKTLQLPAQAPASEAQSAGAVRRSLSMAWPTCMARASCTPTSPPCPCSFLPIRRALGLSCCKPVGPSQRARWGQPSSAHPDHADQVEGLKVLRVA
jgi:hypothetical protein